MELLKTIYGTVVHGTAQGQKIGFPTINVVTPGLVLDFGVYACRVTVADDIYNGAMHFGPRRVLNLMEPLLEIHLLDFKGDLYDQKVKVDIFNKVRGTEDFENMDSLKEQIKKDVEAVKILLKNFE